LSRVAQNYNFKPLTNKTKILAFQGQNPLEAKIQTGDKTIVKQVNKFQYVGCSTGL
jgi:hypothetical protein